MPVIPGTPYRENGRRTTIDNRHFYNRDTIRTSGNTRGWAAGQLLENLVLGLMDTEGHIGNGWIATPYSLSTGEDIIFNTTATTSGIDAFCEFQLTASEDVSWFFVPGTKIRWGSDLTGWGHALVTTVNGGIVWCVGPMGGSAPGGSNFLLEMSCDAYPMGWPSGDSWLYTISSPVDGSGYASGTGVAVSFGADAWKSPTAQWTLRIPGGPIELSFQAYVEGTKSGAAAGINLGCGLSQGGSTQPPGDLDCRDFSGPLNTSRKMLQGSARRNLLNTGSVHTWAMSFYDGGTTDTYTVMTQSRPVVVKARMRYNDL